MQVGRHGTSPHFVVAGVLIKDDGALERCCAGIQKFITDNRIGRREFKFNQCDNELRLDYLRNANALPWQYLAIVLNKAKATGPGFRYKASLHKYVISLLLQNANPYLRDAFVIFDACGSRDFKRTMVPYIKRKASKNGDDPIKRVSAKASHSDPMLQLADMVAGAVSRAFKPEMSDHTLFRSIIRGRELGVQFWPR